MSTATLQTDNLNGIDTSALRAMIQDVGAHSENGTVRFGVATHWKGGTLSETRVEGYEIAGRYVPRSFRILIDEPHELCGTNTRPNPQEMLMAALNACMMVGCVALSAVHGVALEHVEIQTRGELDLRGFLGLDASVKPGYDRVHYTVRIRGNGTTEQFRQIHEAVMATSPNRWNVANPIELTSELVVL